MKGLCILYNGFEELEAIAPLAILRRAKIRVDIYSNQVAPHGKHEIGILSNQTKNYQDYDFLIIPGGPQYMELQKDNHIREMIYYFHQNNKLIASICAGPTILGKLGLLQGKNYTCFTSMNEDFGGNYLDQYVVEDGNLITGRSAAAAIDFAFAILKHIGGKELENEIKKQIYY